MEDLYRGHLSLGDVYLRMNNTSQSLQSLDIAFSISKKLKDKEKESDVLIQRAHVRDNAILTMYNKTFILLKYTKCAHSETVLLYVTHMHSCLAMRSGDIKIAQFNLISVQLNAKIKFEWTFLERGI